MSRQFRSLILFVLIVSLPLPVSAQAPIGSPPIRSAHSRLTLPNGTTG